MAELNSAIFIMINTTSILKKKEIILFDGHCILCNRLILFIIKKDPKSIFQFAALESETGKKYCFYEIYCCIESCISTERIQ